MMRFRRMPRVTPQRGSQPSKGATAEVGGKRGIVAVYDSSAGPKREAVDAEALFRAGLQLFERNERSRDAALVFERAYQSKPADPRYASYYGLSLALSSSRLREAEALCAHAVEIDFCRPELFHNLGRVRLLRSDRKGAYVAFQKGLSVNHDDARIQREVAKLGIRRSPVIRFLGRRHPLNKYIGILISKLDGGVARGT